ncbi:MAG: autotransporter domain-containing protein [Candidatus Latescibacteria bacterium]|nr:autotransporter domain-containing protein [Candidatus Latescibacterota bacterium]NIO27256.1 autotransporter domain-containing protein [Candidatus Latescibacterota bacterium]NIO54780.1 autotransporter domain-containing protein [Candidatus Latescibacterota bacterium]NIT00863.1 autotransporter domain-containing protein [Candidatus Latescibacterota bacterium]NIT37786.1 autotransporter domain-containing protein [Candidatus Latescibacterota bacterium]
MKHMVVVALVVFLLAGVCQVSPALAGHPHERTGFFIGFGGGGGSATFQDAGSRTGGAVGNFRIGYAVAPNLTIGLESSAWLKREEYGVVGLGSATATWVFSVATFGATFFPGNNGPYIKAGVGFGTASVETEATIFGLGTGSLKIDDSGFGILGAVGYEARLTPKFALGPEIEFAYMNVGGDLQSANYVSGSLMFSWYW